jgi:putative membrane protein
MILRDYLALERTCLANERTLLAYSRTARMLCVSGVNLIKLFGHIPALVVTGYLLLPAALLVAMAGWHRFAQVRRRIAAGG